MSITYRPEPGDLVLYTIHGNRDAHVAFFHSWINDYRFRDLGGNTGPSDISNGGQVLKQERSRDMVHVFVRLTL